MPSGFLCGIALCVAKCFGCHEDGTGPCSEAIPPVVRRECGNLASVVWNGTLGCVVNVLCLRCNADRLKNNMRRLMAEKEDVMRKAGEAAAERGGENLSVVETWAQSVVELNGEVEELHKSVHSCMVVLKFLCLSYGVKECLTRVEELRREGKSFTDLVGPAPRPASVSQFTSANINPDDDPRINQVQQLLVDDQIGVVGVSGAAGSGYTALLRGLNNEPSPPGVHGFDVVIGISFSGNPSVEELQAEIGRQLGVRLSADGAAADERSRARVLNRALSRRRFLLLLDDVRDKGTIRNIYNQVGIPDLRPKRSKIVFTTPSREIARLGDKEFVLMALSGEQPWDLFCKNLSGEAKEAIRRDEGMRATAKEIVQLCSGSPSVLINVARAVSGSHPSLDQWDNLYDAWRWSIDELPGMDLILLSVKLNYDLLPSDALRSCLLYCCLFPERRVIDKTQLVEYWVGEGLPETGKEWEPIEIARVKGSTCINKLVDRSLLCDLGQVVMMPESARRLVVNLTDGRSDGGNKFVVLAGTGCLEVRGAESWSDAERVSLMHNCITRLPDSIPKCPKLCTLLLNHNRRLEIVTPAASTATGSTNLASSSAPPAAAAASTATDITNIASSSSAPPAAAASTATDITNIASSSAAPSSSLSIVMRNNQRRLFEFMTGIRVLDLSSTSTGQLPSEIGLLRELVYLNLSNTNISCLPDGLTGLVKLRQLDLRGTKELRQIRHGIISELKKLQALNLYEGGYHLCFDDQGERDGWEGVLRDLQSLDEFGVNIKTPFPWRTLPEEFVRFRSSTRFLKIASSEKAEEQVFDVCQFPNLKVLQLSSLPLSAVMAVGGARPSPPPLQKLRHLYISSCDRRQDLEWVQNLLPRLVIHRTGDSGSGLWQRLQNIYRQIFPAGSS